MSKYDPFANNTELLLRKKWSVREGNSSGSNIPDGRCIVCYSKGGSSAEVRPRSIRPICKGGRTRHTGGTNIAARVRTLDDGIAPTKKVW